MAKKKIVEEVEETTDPTTIDEPVETPESDVEPETVDDIAETEDEDPAVDSDSDDVVAEDDSDEDIAVDEEPAVAIKKNRILMTRNLLALITVIAYIVVLAGFLARLTH